MEFWRGDELLNALRTQSVAEVGVAELALEYTSLLVFYASS
jgi:hypothetical protein